MFSKVTLDSGINKDSFLVCGYPTGEKDLTGYAAYEKFLDKLDYGDEICVHADVYTYGEGEYVDADINELAYMNKRAEADPNFLSNHCSFVENTDFFVDYYPEAVPSMAGG